MTAMNGHDRAQREKLANEAIGRRLAEIHRKLDALLCEISEAEQTGVRVGFTLLLWTGNNLPVHYIANARRDQCAALIRATLDHWALGGEAQPLPPAEGR